MFPAAALQITKQNLSFKREKKKKDRKKPQSKKNNKALKMKRKN